MRYKGTSASTVFDVLRFPTYAGRLLIKPGGVKFESPYEFTGSQQYWLFHMTSISGSDAERPLIIRLTYAWILHPGFSNLM